MSDLEHDEQDELDEHGFIRAATFNEWCAINAEVIESLMREDPWEVLSKAWYGGFVEGGRWISEVYRKPL